MNDLIKKVQAEFAKDFSKSAIKTMIILWALFVILLTILTDDVWLLAGILAYEVLP